MKLHHLGHHRGYVEKLNALIRGSGQESAALDAIVKQSAWAATADPAARTLFNNASQAWNHAFFWNSLRPKDSGAGPQGALAARIDADFGGQGPLIEAFKAAALGLFGSGWIWLVEDGGALRIMATTNADSPIAHGQVPLLVLDVWEHAYYLDYQSRRAEYVKGVVDHLLNWPFAERNFLQHEAVHA
jgi:Fe-Mn family superoxide dismutase